MGLCDNSFADAAWGHFDPGLCWQQSSWHLSDVHYLPGVHFPWELLRMLTSCLSAFQAGFQPFYVPAVLAIGA